MMLSIKQAIIDKIQKHLEPTVLEIQNDSHNHGPNRSSGTEAETHFSVLIVSEKFSGVSRLERQRLVANLLSEERKQGLHALSMRTFDPAEWQAQMAIHPESFNFDPPACRGGEKKAH